MAVDPSVSLPKICLVPYDRAHGLQPITINYYNIAHMSCDILIF